MKKAGILVCLAVLVMALGAALGCGGESGGNSGMTPKEVADAYLQATVDLDIDTAYELMSEAGQQSTTKEQMAEEAGMMESLELSYALGEETIEGDTATVEVTLTVTDKASGQSQEMAENLPLVKENGEWKVSFEDNM